MSITYIIITRTIDTRGEGGERDSSTGLQIYLQTRVTLTFDFLTP